MATEGIITMRQTYLSPSGAASGSPASGSDVTVYVSGPCCGADVKLTPIPSHGVL